MVQTWTVTEDGMKNKETVWKDFAQRFVSAA
mgnify:FL=1